jgi:hypothetical protein
VVENVKNSPNNQWPTTLRYRWFLGTTLRRAEGKPWRLPVTPYGAQRQPSEPLSRHRDYPRRHYREIPYGAQSPAPVSIVSGDSLRYRFCPDAARPSSSRPSIFRKNPMRYPSARRGQPLEQPRLPATPYGAQRATLGDTETIHKNPMARRGQPLETPRLPVIPYGAQRATPGHTATTHSNPMARRGGYVAHSLTTGAVGRNPGGAQSAPEGVPGMRPQNAPKGRKRGRNGQVWRRVQQRTSVKWSLSAAGTRGTHGSTVHPEFLEHLQPWRSHG